MSTKVSNKEQLMAKQDRLREDKQRVESRIRAIQNQIKEEDRKARTHRLCTRGGMLESFLPDPENITDDTVMDLLRKLFDLAAVKKLVSAIADQSSGSGIGFESATVQEVETPVSSLGGYEIEETDEDE